MHHEQRGTVGAPTTFVLHGVGGRSAQVEALAVELARHDHVVTVDLLGHGKSDVGDGSKGLPAQLDAFVDLVSAVGAVPPVSLAGHSAGGAVALCASHRLPQVDAVVMLDCGLSVTDSMRKMGASILSSLADRGWYSTALDLHTRSIGSWAPDRIEAEVRAAIAETDPAAGTSLMRDVLALDCVEQLARSPARLCYVHSTRPISREALTEICSDIQYHHIERAGHWLQMERPAEVAEVVRRFVDRPAQR